MPLIYFIRHGQTDWNAERRLQGQRDIPLNDTGRSQAARNGLRLREIITQPADFEFVASPLSRTRETMEIVRREMGLGVENFRTDPALKEINYGNWEGFTMAELEATDPDAVKMRAADKWNSNVHGGESYAMLSERARNWFQSVDRDSVIVSHGAFSRCLRGHILGLEQREIINLEVPQDRFFSIRQGQIDWH
ncbi:MAG: histidine phosphatase family protein [Hyphomicrobiaceae bacterium]|nr:histidine phosphatase family protein [Hyphomicrobiaceae bacterium]